MKLLIDIQLPLRLATHLRERGHDCAHVLELGLDEANDVEVWNRAVNDGYVLVSKDEDFVYLANRPDDPGRLIWVRVGNCRNAALLDAFDRVHDELRSAIDSGQQVIEMR